MSTPAATARYIITADDKTKAAIASINSGFKNMERGVRSTVGRINAAFALMAGMGLKRAFQDVLSEAAANSAQFASALDEVKMSARDLLSPKDGLPGAAAAMNDLAETLKDPAVVAAAEKITSTLVHGFTSATKATAEIIGGLTVLLGATGDRIEDLRRQIDDLDGRIARAKARGLPTSELVAEKNRKAAEQMALIEGPLPITGGPTAAQRRAGAAGPISGLHSSDVAFIKDLRLQDTISDSAKMLQFFEQMDTAARNTSDTIKELGGSFDELTDSLGENVDDQLFYNKAISDAEVTRGQDRQKFFEDIAKDAGDVSETIQRTAASLDEYSDRVGDAIDKTYQWSVYSDQAARNIQDAFADFLFDPFQDGLKGMLKGFVDVIRRMLAEAAAAKIFETLFGTSDSTKGNALTSFLGSLIGGASGSYGGGKASGGPLDQGKWYVAGEHGPEPIWGGGPGAFAMGYGRGSGSNVVVNMNVDARGATQDAIKALPAAMRAASDDAVGRVLDLKRRGKL